MNAVSGCGKGGGSGRGIVDRNVQRSTPKANGGKALGAGLVLWGALCVAPALGRADVPSVSHERSAPVGAEDVLSRADVRSGSADVVVEPTRVLAVAEGGAPRGAANPQLALSQPSGAGGSEALGKARGSLSQLRRGVAGLEGILKYAQTQKDAYPASCVERRRAMGDAVVRLGQEAVSAVEEAVRRSNAAEAQYHLSRLQLMGEKVKTLLAEGNLCVHDDASFIQISRREVQIERGIPDGDPAAAR